MASWIGGWMRKAFFTLAGVTLLIVVIVTGWDRFGRVYTPAWSRIDPPAQAPEIELAETNGGSFRLSELQGKLVLVFFGYTHCPDICPGTLKNMQFVFEQLGDQTGEVRFVFVTVDPARDTPERMRSYLALFHPEFIGLTGSAEALERAYADYTVNVVKGPAAGIAGYDVAHASRIFVIDREGRLVGTFPYGLSRESILADLQHLLSQQDT
ncbi:MAG TPA: SCO family protein [Anaerolineales bacterium]|nr:SCO family protein [Anaerolineales bacterium]